MAKTNKNNFNNLNERKGIKFYLGITMIIIGIFCFGFLACAYLLNYSDNSFQWNDEESYSTTSFSFKPNTIPQSEEDIVNNCKDLNLFKTSQCLIENVATFYKYEKTEDSLNLSFNELKENGGDCRNYAFLYESLGKQLGFNATTNTYKGIPEVHNAHRWAVIWDENDYCELDLKKVNCYKIDKPNKDRGNNDE